jgi:magnesium-transporting ATPase (P-type)
VRAFADDGGAITGMCGDGGNDCAALRGATFGFALSESDAGECLCLCVFVRMYVCVGVCVCVFRCVRMYVCECACVCAFVRVCLTIHFQALLRLSAAATRASRACSVSWLRVAALSPPTLLPSSVPLQNEIIGYCNPVVI